MENNLDNIKSEFKGLLDDFKKFVFGEDEKKPEENQKFSMTGTLDDGTPVMIDGDVPNVGVPVMVQNAQGEVAPIADGEYVVKVGEESYTIKCVGGLIAESSAPPAEDTNPNTEQMANEKIAELEARIAALEGGAKNDTAMEETNKVREITVQMSSEIEALKKENSELKEKAVKIFELVEKFLNTPETKPTHVAEEKAISDDEVSKFRKEFLGIEI